MVSGNTKVYGLFGYPVEHSFSPGMHNAAFARLVMDACYVPFLVHPDFLKNAVQGMRAMNLRGMNVTVPHKQAVIEYLDGLSEEARLIGAVNTIEVLDGSLIGHNTDGRGFIRSLRDDARFNPKGKRILFIGSGGAARAVGFSLALAGAGTIDYLDLDNRKASILAREMQTKTGAKVDAIDSGHLSRAAADADCIINATPVGLKKTDPLPFNAGLIQKQHLVCDLVYNPSETKLLMAAKARGARTLSGIGMLLYQGVIAFEIWTNKKAPVQVMKNALARQIRSAR